MSITEKCAGCEGTGRGMSMDHTEQECPCCKGAGELVLYTEDDRSGSGEAFARHLETLPGGANHDDGRKPPVDQIPTASLEDVARVIGYGAKKYGMHNWRKGARWGRYAASALRHIFAWLRGQDCDVESGEPHLAHAICNLLFIMEWQRYGVGEDDRYKP